MSLSSVLQVFKTREKWFNVFGATVTIVSLLAATVIYFILTEKNIIAGQVSQSYWLVGSAMLLLAILACAVGWRCLRIWKMRKQKAAGAQLHVQLIAAFSALAAMPAILVAVFAIAFIHIGVQEWFGEQIHTAVNESQSVAQSYLQEHQQSIRVDMLAMASDLNREALKLNSNKKFLQEYFKTQAYLRNLSEAILLDSTGHVIARAGISLTLELLPPDFEKMIQRAKNGETVLFVGENGDRVRALVKLDNFLDAYLFVGRFVDENVLSHVIMTNKAVDTYSALERNQAKMKLTMTIIFVLVALILLLIAVWAGLTLADRIVGPVSRLIQASERVRAGDMNTRVEEENDDTEINLLARAFNRMIDQLSTQRRDLINANRQLDTRRRFTETVLGGVNAGIIAIDAKGIIQIANVSAEKLLHRPQDQIVGKKLAEVCPEIEKIRRVLRSKGGGSLETPIDVDSISSIQSHWIVRMTAEGTDDEAAGYVATFDDLSPLMDAQRKAAWADVARRVAHEIKNPLTPIQLSAERLKKRYSKQILQDIETFENCTDTIIRHVDDIRHMVDEFSAFARMPTASKRVENISILCQQALVLFQQAHRDVKFTFVPPETPVMLQVDRQQISQALTNIIKNAYEALRDAKIENGQVTLSVQEVNNSVVISLSDNGTGWPTELLPRLADPYVTTKVTGSGLGLAIVAKIVEDHEGRLEFKENVPQGATINLIFPKTEELKNVA